MYRTKQNKSDCPNQEVFLSFSLQVLFALAPAGSVQEFTDSCPGGCFTDLPVRFYAEEKKLGAICAVTMDRVVLGESWISQSPLSERTLFTTTHLARKATRARGEANCKDLRPSSSRDSVKEP